MKQLNEVVREKDEQIKTVETENERKLREKMEEVEREREFKS